MSLIDILPPITGTYRSNVDLSATNWFQVGGEAEVLFKPKDVLDLANFLKHRPKEVDLTILGVGSNVIVRDGGIRGVVIKLGRYFNSLEVKENHITAGAATLDFNLAQFAAENALSGLEFMVGVPGCVGGALAMNAGAYDGQTSSNLLEAEAVNIGTGEICQLSNADFGFVYRGNSLGNKYIFTKATFSLKEDAKESILQRMAKIIEQRTNTQPIKERTGGSTFKNPNGYKAWELIDKAGCRGLSIGGAKMSEKHCNFLINTGEASAADIENLGELVIEKVFNSSRIKLEWEIKRIGERA